MLQRYSEARIKANGAIVEKSVATALRPDPRMRVSEWAAKHRVVAADASELPGKWSNDVAPELVEIMDRLSPDDRCANVVVMKCAQSGGSEAGGNWLCFIMHMTPGPAMYVGPTVSAAKDWRVEKLDPTIVVTDVLNPAKGGVVRAQKSRSGEGSTTNRLRFKGGYILFAGANSAATLRQHSIRFMVRDDRSAWTKNAEGEGDPKKLSDARLKVARRYGNSKVLDISTPVIKGENIDSDYMASDQRRFYMACKNDACGMITDVRFEDIVKNKTPPYRCRWFCPACKTEHSDADKPAMKSLARGATWIPTVPDADGVVPPLTMHRDEAERWRAPHEVRKNHSYAQTGEITSFETWDELASQDAEAGEDPEKRKPFENSGLGRAYEVKGEGPGWELLSARREAEWHRGTAPAGALYFTLTVDVQGDGLYWERVGWGPNKESWLIGCGYLSGTTDAPLEGAWPKLDMIVDRGFRLASGARLGDDLIGVDSGFNIHAVSPWVKRRHNAMALKGEDGWSKPPIFRAKDAEVKHSGPNAGRAKKFGVKIWLIGTYGLKSALMIYLGRVPKENKSGFPNGYCHWPADTPEAYFRHMSSEYVKTNDDGERVWEKKGANHWLDCRVYNMALTHHAGIWAWSDKKWADRAAELTQLAAPPPTLFDHAASTGAAAVAPVDDDADVEVIEAGMLPLPLPKPAQALAVINKKQPMPRPPMTVAQDPYL
ncbi:MAG: phage terminase large subunit family protein [Bradyrhizobium sp.]|uniref:terminase gpA endonuclease subunit n=1 Tax=Bradyrhizobium sp. TaxID=376 RepID=UPI002731009C|nr:terminase gpA endonuclease subunit [Bradyrhizobium sp.]MDP1866989.1 phage terminase large subunit family protein [Bradyrhizobium sp.]